MKSHRVVVEFIHAEGRTWWSRSLLLAIWRKRLKRISTFHTKFHHWTLT